MGRNGALAAALIMFFLVGCGKDDDDNVNSVNAVISSETVLHFRDAFSVSFSDRSELSGATAVLSLTNDENLSALANDQATELDARFASSSFITLSLTKEPTGPIIIFIKDAEIVAKAATDEAPVIFAALLGESDTELDTFTPLATNSDDKDNNISATIPVYAFRRMGDGTYEAKVLLGLQKGTVTPNQSSLQAVGSSKNSILSSSYGAPTTADDLDLLCPLPGTGCTETSMFNHVRHIRSYGKVKAHLGVDFVAQKELDVYLPGAGKVDRGLNQEDYKKYFGKDCKTFKGAESVTCVNANSGGIFLVIKYDSFSVKIIHLSSIDKGLLNEDGTIKLNSVTKEGIPVGRTGKTGTAERTGSHLHYELYARRIFHKKTKAGTTTSLGALIQVDPFPSMVSSLEIVEEKGKNALKKDEEYKYTIHGFDADKVKVNSSVQGAQEYNGFPPPPTTLYDPTRKICAKTDKPETLKFFPNADGRVIFNGNDDTYCIRWGDKLNVKALNETAPATITVRFNEKADVSLASAPLSAASGEISFSGIIFMGTTFVNGTYPDCGLFSDCNLGERGLFDLRIANIEFDPSSTSNNLRIITPPGRVDPVSGHDGGQVAGTFTLTKLTDSSYMWKAKHATYNSETNKLESYDVNVHLNLPVSNTIGNRAHGSITSSFPNQHCQALPPFYNVVKCTRFNDLIDIPVIFDVLPKEKDRDGHDIVARFAPEFPYCLKNSANRFVPIGFDEITQGKVGDCNFYLYSREDD